MATEKTNDLNENKKTDSPPKKAEKTEDNNNTSVDTGATRQTDTNQTEELKDIKEQLTIEKDRVLRLSAEFENYKKRKQREIDEFKKFANESVFRQMLTVVDNLERAIVSAEDTSDEKALLEGVKLTHKEIIKLFETYHVKPVDAESQPFDPNYHQAVTQEETDDLPENTVSKVLQKGYVLHDRLIRPAMVVVSKNVQNKTEDIKEK